MKCLTMPCTCRHVSLKLLFKMYVRKNYPCIMLNKYPRSSDSALVLWEEKIEKSSKFAIPLYHEEQPPGRAFCTQQVKCGCALLGLYSNPNPTCDTAVTLMIMWNQGSGHTARHHCGAHRCILRCKLFQKTLSQSMNWEGSSMCQLWKYF